MLYSNVAGCLVSFSMSPPSLCHHQSDEDEPDVDSDFDDGSFSVSDGSNRSNRNKKKPKSAKKKKKGWHGNITRMKKSALLSVHQIWTNV